MALAIRLRQQGRRNHCVFRVVVMDARSRRDGKYLEELGWYNPYEAEKDRGLNIKADRIQHWVSQGAQMSESVACLVKGVAPSVIRWHTEQRVARQTKRREKRKSREASRTA